MTLYEINIRVFRHRFGTDTTLLDIPDQFWQYLANKGIDFVWLMGVWQTPNQEIIHRYALEKGLQEEYSRALPDWRPEDVIGSPYAIDQYQLHPDLGGKDDLLVLKQKLNQLGLKLVLDFVPNHFHADSSLIASHPEVFLKVPDHYLAQDTHTYYKSSVAPYLVLAHGKDPYFAAWKDTVQVNYGSIAARQFMQQQLLTISEYCDGLRCDMAMLAVNQVFDGTWGHLDIQKGHSEEFWPAAIQAVKAKQPDFIFLAEVYWDMEWDLQQMGFDYTYDKRLLDRLLEGDTEAIRFHLRADSEFQEKSARFLENHDETAILQNLDSSRAQAAAVITYLQAGLRFFHNGQWEGRRHRLPVQLGRAPVERRYAGVLHDWLKKELVVEAPFAPVHFNNWVFYQGLLDLLQRPLFRKGSPKEFDLGVPQVLAYHWTWLQEEAWVIVNYAATSTRIQLPKTMKSLVDFFNGDPWEGKVLLSPFQYLVLTAIK